MQTRRPKPCRPRRGRAPPSHPSQHAHTRAQVSAAVNPEGEQGRSFRECVIVRHPRRDGEFAFAFITGQTVLQLPEGDQQLYCVYVPTNHVYVGDIFLLGEQDIIRTTLSVREGIGARGGPARSAAALPPPPPSLPPRQQRVLCCADRLLPRPLHAEIVVSVGMAVPPTLVTSTARRQ